MSKTRFWKIFGVVTIIASLVSEWGLLSMKSPKISLIPAFFLIAASLITFRTKLLSAWCFLNGVFIMMQGYRELESIRYASIPFSLALIVVGVLFIIRSPNYGVEYSKTQ